MSGIHDAIMRRVQEYLEANLVHALPVDDPSRATVVKCGALQGDPDPDEARIFITIFENDPDDFITGAVTGMSGRWSDVIEDTEIGLAGGQPVTTWKRRFTLKARLLLDTSREEEKEARTLASTVRTRIEHLLPQISFSGIMEDGEYVSNRIITDDRKGEMIEAGGPPDSYDFLMKIRFSLWTTTGGA